jgi:hypothetical protein
MKHRPAAAAVALAVGIVGLLGLAGCSVRAKAEKTGPFLSILILRQDGAAEAHRTIAPGSVTLALAGLPPEELPRLRQRLAQSTDAALRRAAPSVFDLEAADDSAALAADPLRDALPDLPALTAATNVLGAPWIAPGLSVRLGPSCADGASRCVPLFGPAFDREDALLRRGRALAWSLGNAARLRVSAGSRAAVLQSLRASQTLPTSTIALVFGAPRGTLDEVALEGLREQARLSLADVASDALQRPWLDALCAARASWELPIAFDADEVLVIPRLSALARLQEFRSEVQVLSGR